MTDPELVDAVAEAMTGWPLDRCGPEEAESWRANARAAIAAVRRHDLAAEWEHRRAGYPVAGFGQGH